MPHLARLLDGMPRERSGGGRPVGPASTTRSVSTTISIISRSSTATRGWEWVEAIQALSGTILQPTLAPLRTDVGSFLFHGYDRLRLRGRTARPSEAAAAWKAAGPAEKPYGVMYVGSNWQRWDQVRQFLEQYASGPLRGRAGVPWSAGTGVRVPTGPCRTAFWASIPIPRC